ncbi:MAG: ribonuclease P protein component [Candidatus Saccharimonadales bacterium]
MLTKKHRFSSRRAIQRLYASSTVVRLGTMTARVKRAQSGHGKVGVVVSKKVHKSAVVRNRIRRRLYEALRTKHEGVVENYELLITVYDARLAVAPAKIVSSEVANLTARLRRGTWASDPAGRVGGGKHGRRPQQTNKERGIVGS